MNLRSETPGDSTALKRRAGGYTAAILLILIAATAGLTLARRSIMRDQAPDAKTSSQPIVDSAVLRASATIPRPDAMSWQELDDPANDGWATEAVGNQTTAQLKKLGKLLNRSASVDAADFAQLASDDFVGEPLVPDQLELVYEDDIFRVERNKSDPPDKADEEMSPLRGPDGLAQGVRDLSRRVHGAEGVRFEVKTFRVETADGLVTTRHYVTLFGQAETLMVEQHATWTVRWIAGTGGAAPQMTELRVDDFEQIQLRDPGRKLFSDCTESVLSQAAGYREQFLYGFGYWTERIHDKRFFNLLGNPGIAIGDVNGLEDLYVCQEAGLPNRLFVQQPDGSVRDTSDQAGVNWLHNSRSALLVDFDNDGDQDLAVAIDGGVILAEGDGKGRFTLRTVLDTTDDTMSLAAADYDQDGRVDLYVCVYYRGHVSKESVGVAVAAAAEDFVYHDANDGGKNSLFRNEVNAENKWQFTDVTSRVGLDENNQRYSLATAWEDYDNDGDQDLYVANDFGRNNLYRNDRDHDGTSQFVDVAAQAAVEDSASGMSVTWADYDRDGQMDVYVSNMFSAAGNRVTFQDRFKADAPEIVKARLQRFARGNTLLRNLGDGTFADVSTTGNVTMGRWAWGSNFVDLNNDGWEDLFVANGFITTENTGDL